MKNWQECIMIEAHANFKERIMIHADKRYKLYKIATIYVVNKW